MKAVLEEAGELSSISTKELKTGMFESLPRVWEGSQVAPDCSLDDTDAVVCSLEQGVRAVIMARVKEEAEKDKDSRALVDWIRGAARDQ